LTVVDTSVALKWVLREPDTDLAKRAVTLTLIAPDFWRVEAANGLRRAVAMGQATAEYARDGLRALGNAPVKDVPTARLLRSGLDLALELRHSIQDCLFLALAIEQDTLLLTADEKFRDLVAARSTHGPRILLLSEWTP
jgi:predicted nucleic acid-binding protein